MNYGIVDLLNLLGSLGLFLFGMKLMSEALQRVAGDKMRNILAAMTANRFTRILTGALVTTVIQSSSATTVMVVSFVNAGLLSLVQSVGVIMGANIGTTFTAWVISLLGFKFSISQLAIPFIGLGIPLLFSKSNTRKSWGEVIAGFALLFLGLDFLKSSVPNIGDYPEMLAFLGGYTDMGFGSILLFVLIGTIVTIVIQSSSATMALTLVMCNNGWIPYELAAAMVLGENIGTTITANLAASVGNVSAKRAARAHLIFNLFGVLWMVAIFHPFLRGIAWLEVFLGGKSPFESSDAIPVALATFHSTFNIINTLIMVWFTSFIVRVVTRIVPQKAEDEEFRLKYISLGLLQTSEMSLLQAKKEIEVYAQRVTRMFGMTRDMLMHKNDKDFEKVFDRICKYEEICDRIEVEIATYLNRIATSDLSTLSQKRMMGMYKVISNLESIADCNYNIAKTIKRKRSRGVGFDDDMRGNINVLFDLIGESLAIMEKNLKSGYMGVELELANQIEEKINQYRNVLKSDHIRNLEANKYTYETGVFYSDIFTEAERLGDYCNNVTEDIVEVANK